MSSWTRSVRRSSLGQRDPGPVHRAPSKAAGRSIRLLRRLLGLRAKITQYVEVAVRRSVLGCRRRRVSNAVWTSPGDACPRTGSPRPGCGSAASTAERRARDRDRATAGSPPPGWRSGRCPTWAPGRGSSLRSQEGADSLSARSGRGQGQCGRCGGRRRGRRPRSAGWVRRRGRRLLAAAGPSRAVRVEVVPVSVAAAGSGAGPTRGRLGMRRSMPPLSQQVRRWSCWATPSTTRRSRLLLWPAARVRFAVLSGMPPPARTVRQAFLALRRAEPMLRVENAVSRGGRTRTMRTRHTPGSSAGAARQVEARPSGRMSLQRWHARRRCCAWTPTTWTRAAAAARPTSARARLPPPRWRRFRRPCAPGCGGC